MFDTIIWAFDSLQKPTRVFPLLARQNGINGLLNHQTFHLKQTTKPFKWEFRSWDIQLQSFEEQRLLHVEEYEPSTENIHKRPFCN